MFSSKSISVYTARKDHSGTTFFQPKLKVNQPGDKYEVEADTTADRVMRMTVQRKCKQCDEEEQQIHRQEVDTSVPNRYGDFENYVSKLGGHGRALSASERDFFEPRFNRDFSEVRIHTDSRAAESAKQINARAYTAGRNIVFNDGQYQPHTEQGKRLLAHELTHVVQQGEGVNQIQRSPGSPAGGCGLCYGNTRAVGQAAHNIIQAAMLLRYPFLIAEQQLLPSTGDENGFLDLAYFHGDNEVTIGEIKPANAQGLLQGDIDLIWYETQLAGLGFNVHRMRLPPPMASLLFPTLAPPGCLSHQQLFVDPPVQGIYTYFCEPDYSVLIRSCDCRRGRRERVPERVPEPQPVPVAERNLWERIKGFVEELIESGQDIGQAIDTFLRANRDLINLILAAGIAGLIATIGEDILTAGAGIADDLVTIPIFAQMIRIAWRLRALAI